MKGIMWAIHGDKGYEIVTPNGVIYAENVIIATGTNPKAHIPSFALELNENIVQIHSSQYKNPESFPALDTLVVGAGTSGVEIAIELSKSRPTMISGRGTPHIPDFVFRFAGKLYWWFAHNVLTNGTPIGRKAKPEIINRGAPLISVSMKNVKEAGIEHLPDRPKWLANKQTGCIRKIQRTLFCRHVIPVWFNIRSCRRSGQRCSICSKSAY